MGRWVRCVMPCSAHPPEAVARLIDEQRGLLEGGAMAAAIEGVEIVEILVTLLAPGGQSAGNLGQPPN